MIFVDTNAWVALADSDDKFHKDAVSWFKTHSQEKFITSNLIIIESLGWLRYNRGKNLSVAVGMNLYLGSDIHIEKVLSSDEKTAWRLFQKLEGRSISMVDCTSFALMKRLKVKEVFTFDQDFQKQGFIVYP